MPLSARPVSLLKGFLNNFTIVRSLLVPVIILQFWQLTILTADNTTKSWDILEFLSIPRIQHFDIIMVPTPMGSFTTQDWQRQCLCDCQRPWQRQCRCEDFYGDRQMLLDYGTPDLFCEHLRNLVMWTVICAQSGTYWVDYFRRAIPEIANQTRSKDEKASPVPCSNASLLYSAIKEAPVVIYFPSDFC